MLKGTYPRTSEHRAQQSAALKGRPKSPEHRAAIGDAMMGHVVTAQTRAKMGASHRARSLARERREAQKEARERAILVWQALGDALREARGQTPTSGEQRLTSD
jgi:hypothetical protein